MMLWDRQDPFVEHYTSMGTTVASSSYCDILMNHLRPTIRSECQGLLSTGVLLHHDNAGQQTANCLYDSKRDQGHLSVPPILHTCLTSPIAISKSLKHSRWLLLERLSNPTKIYTRGNAQVATYAARGLFFF